MQLKNSVTICKRQYLNVASDIICYLYIYTPVSNLLQDHFYCVNSWSSVYGIESTGI